MATTSMTESQIVTGLLAELPVPAEATTSRVVVNNELLRVVVFAMDAGQELTEHTSTRAVTVQLLSGELDFQVGDVRHALAAGDVIYLAPNERHALVARQACRFTLVMVDVDQAHR